MKTNTSKHIVRLIIFIMTIASLPFSSFAAASSDISKIPDSTTPEATHNLTDCVIGGADFDLVTPEDVAGKSAESKRKFLSGKSTSQMRELPLLVICIGFNDIKYIDDYDWGDKIFSDSDYSVRKFYKDNSMGKFSFAPAQETSQYGVDGNTNVNDKANDGVVHVNVDADHGDWTSTGLNNYMNLCMLWADFKQALEKADEYVNFKQYDANNDGYITTNELALSFIVAGGEGANMRSPIEKTMLHSHASSLNDLYSPRLDGVKASSYIAVAENLVYLIRDDIINYFINLGFDKSIAEALATFYMMGDKEREITQNNIATLAHELGHYLGLPDFYDTVYSKDHGSSYSDYPWMDYDVGEMSVMASGSWCMTESGEFRPSAFDACSRTALGWVEPEVADKDGEYTVNAENYGSASGYSVVKIPTDREDEYYLVENRQYSSWDEGLKQAYYPHNESFNANGGLVIWHVDEGIARRHMSTNTVNNTDHRPAYMPLYMEMSGETGTDYSFINNYVDVHKPFFDKTVCEKSVGAELYLPEYSTEEDKPAARTINEDRKIEILDNSQASMRIKVTASEDPGDQEATITKVPAAMANLKYTGAAQKLVEAGEAEGGTMKYAATTDETIPKATTFSTDIPTAVNAGTYYVWWMVEGDSEHTSIEPSETNRVSVTIAEADEPVKPVVQKKDNPLAVKGRTAKVKYSKLKKKTQKLAVGKVISFKRNGQGQMSYLKTSGSKKITINKKNGKITIKKGLKKGTYRVKVKISASGNAEYKPAVKVTTIKIKVK